MRSCLKLLGRSALLVVLCVAVGFALLLAAFALPTEPMREHAYASRDVFAREGSYPMVRTLGVDTKLDNFTDSMMLIHAGYQAPETTHLQRTLNVYRPFPHGNSSPVGVYAESLAAPTPAPESNYGRYWHGYLAVLKPMLSIFTYEQLRAFNAVWVAALALTVAALMWRRGLRRYILPFMVTVLLFDPVATAMNMFYTQVYAVTMLACIAILAGWNWLRAREGRLLLLFTLTGCLTSYLDLLTCPLVSFGIPCALCLCLAATDWKGGLKLALTALICWGIGYGGMWAGKWLLSALLGGEDIGLLETLQLRSSAMGAPDPLGAVALIVKRLLVQLRVPMLGAALLLALVLGVLFLRRSPWEKLKSLEWLPWAALCLLPFFWIAFTQNHSYIHRWFVYRLLAICVFGGLCMLARLAEKRPAPRVGAGGEMAADAAAQAPRQR